jgi:hypothetical protein
MGHLFYDYGITTSNPGLFTNLQQDWYWLGTDYDDDPEFAWRFSFEDGYQETDRKTGDYAWAVRDGDVAPVPEPTTMLLLGSSLICLAGFRRKYRKS